MALILGKVTAVDWLTDERWIVFSFYGNFPHYLEHLYFTPGTAKNDEFEVMAATVRVNEVTGIAPFFRIKDTAENRDTLRAALAEFNEKHLLSIEELNKNIKNSRRQIKAVVLPLLR